MKRIVAFFAVALAFAVSGCSLLGPSQTEEARAAFEEQSYLAARDLASAALEENSEDTQALDVMLRAQLAMGAGPDALATLERLAALEGSPADAHLLEAEALLQTGEIEDALALLDGDETSEAWRLRALAAALADDDAGVREAFLRGGDAEGEKARLFTAEATYHLRRENREEARAAVGRAQQVAPRRVETQFVTAWLAQLEGNHEVAARAFLAILERTPNDRPAMLGAIDALQKLDRDDLADPLIAEGRNAYPGDLTFVYFAARSFGRAGNWASARDLLQEYEAEMVGEEPAQLLYAEALLELGQGELARAILTPIRNKRRGDEDISMLWERAVEATQERSTSRSS